MGRLFTIAVGVAWLLVTSSIGADPRSRRTQVPPVTSPGTSQGGVTTEAAYPYCTGAEPMPFPCGNSLDGLCKGWMTIYTGACSSNWHNAPASKCFQDIVNDYWVACPRVQKGDRCTPICAR